MSIKKVILNYAKYNHWANDKMMQWLKTLERPLLYKETASSFGSIDLTLQHMIRAQKFWLNFIIQADLTTLDETIKIDAADIVINDLMAGSREILDKFNSYTEEALLEQLPKDNMVQCRYEYMLHVINHNTYHRGQIVTMSRCLGIINNIPETDYDAFLWYEH